MTVGQQHSLDMYLCKQHSLGTVYEQQSSVTVCKEHSSGMVANNIRM